MRRIGELGMAVVVLAAFACAAQASVLGKARSDVPTLRCREVARSLGLQFRTRYGDIITTEPGGMIMQRNMGNGAAVGDIDRDGDLDIYLLGQAGQPNALYRNDLDPGGKRQRYVEIGVAAGVADVGLGRVAHFADLDGDAWLDLILVNDTEPDGSLPGSKIYRNRGDGTFEDVTKGSGFDPVGYLVGGATASDVDLDGDLDIYVALWTMELGGTVPGLRPQGVFPGSNRLYRNEGDFRFRDISRDVGLGGIMRDTFTPIFHDFDADGDPDLYLPVDAREDLYFENDDGMFMDRSLEAGVDHVGNDMGVALADVDDDGRLDMFVTNISDPEENFGRKPRGNTLLLNQVVDGQLRFSDAAHEYGVRDTAWGWGASFVDMDLDTDLDLVAVQGFDEFVDIYSRSLRDARSALFRNDGPGLPFTRANGTGCDVGGDQRALVPFDHDRDGDLDLLVTQVSRPTLLLENRTKGGHWLTVQLDGPGGTAAGARVDVTVDGHTTSQLVLHGGSYLAGPPLEATFGFGSATAAELVRVTDARGLTVELRDVPADQVLPVAPWAPDGR